ncbi:MAG: YkvA family protein [Erysipelotrichaceae bacterium]|jgi:uncharacterized membrane protein YkvA (DUF1232 family)
MVEIEKEELYKKSIKEKIETYGDDWMDLKTKAEKMKTEIPAIFLALKDKDTPIIAKIFAGITVAYALSPIDIIPDFVPVLGYFDDIILLPLLVLLTIKFIPENIIERNRLQAEKIWKDGKPGKWYFAIPILVIWISVIILILNAVLKKKQ